MLLRSTEIFLCRLLILKALGRRPTQHSSQTEQPTNPNELYQRGFFENPLMHASRILPIHLVPSDTKCATRGSARQIYKDYPAISLTNDNGLRPLCHG